MRLVQLLACAAVAGAFASQAPAALDSIGTSPAATNGGFWLTSITNNDIGGIQTTCAGVGTITIPAGQRVTEIHAVIGGRGPNGQGNLNPVNIPEWQVHFWSDVGAFAADRYRGNVVAAKYQRPANADYAVPFGADQFGQTTYFVRFRVPGGILAGTTAHFAVRGAMSVASVGSFGVIESTIPATPGLWASGTLGAPGYLAFNTFPLSTRGGTFAYRIVTGCGADFDSSGTAAVPDIFAFLGDWFLNNGGADFDGNGTVAVPDIFAFLGAWFAGC